MGKRSRSGRGQRRGLEGYLRKAPAVLVVSWVAKTAILAVIIQACS